MDDFSKLLHLLISGNVDFIVVGGIAVALNGYVRATEDVDILIESSSTNIQNLLNVLENWGEGHSKELEVKDFDLKPGAVRINENFPLDVFNTILAKTYHDFFADTSVTDNGIRYLNPASIIYTKKHSIREKDKLDIIAMKRLIQ